MAQRYDMVGQFEPVQLVEDDEFTHERAEAFCVYVTFGASLAYNEPFPSDTMPEAHDVLVNLAEDFMGDDTFLVPTDWFEDQVAGVCSVLNGNLYPSMEQWEEGGWFERIYIEPCDPADFAEA